MKLLALILTAAALLGTSACTSVSETETQTTTTTTEEQVVRQPGQSTTETRTLRAY